MTSMKKMIGFGLLTWLIPFLLSFFFYSPDGKILIDLHLFKSIMIVVSSLIGSSLLLQYYKKVHDQYLKEGIIIGLVWLAISIILDILILLPMAKMGLSDYIAQIGLRYLIIPITSIAFGMGLERAQERGKHT